MLDKEFKTLAHSSKEYERYTSGQKVMDGYFPDYVLKKIGKEKYIIIEFENSSSRKHILGGLIKAANFLSGNREGHLVFVVGKGNINTIAEHLRVYFDWIKNITNLKRVWVISIDDYMAGDAPLPIKSKQFRDIATCLKKR